MDQGEEEGETGCNGREECYCCGTESTAPRALRGETRELSSSHAAEPAEGAVQHQVLVVQDQD